MIRISDIIDKILTYNPQADIDIVERAYVFSARVHDGQMRLSGEPYLSHPLEVAGILANMELDVESIAAGLLHDVIEDTHTTAEEIMRLFGPGVCHIVSGVTKISKLHFKSSEARQAESIRKMILAMADDIRVILVKLADRLHNMRTLQYHRSEVKKIQIAQETFDIYAAIASRLGIYWMKKELEDMCFSYLYPVAYENIKSLIRKDRQEREEYVKFVKQEIKNKLIEAGLSGEVQGRYKHFFSIHNKMITQNLAFEDVYDIVAFRIILDTIPQCYEVLGILHAMWKPIAQKFKDYIGVPKSNMYQSLHTTVIGPKGERIEVQIRTREMDRVAKSGIAAHWSYKEGKNFDQKTIEAFAWIQNLVENQKNFCDPDEFMENVRIDLFPDEVYVFTPQGEIKILPIGASPVDFAYSIHTEVGNQCTGAKVNGRMVPLQYELKTGDTVEIITTKGHEPSKDWIGFVKTVRARSRIRQWIKSQEKERSLTLGREICEKTFRKHRLNFNIFIKSRELDTVLEALGYQTAEDLIAAVGYGKITPLQIINRYVPKEKTQNQSLLEQLIKRTRKKKSSEGVVVTGMNDILIKFGKCCQPVPGDPIVGYITQGQGVRIHHKNCANVLKMNPERKVEVEWNEDFTDQYPVKIHVRSSDRSGLLADIANAINKCGANILTVHAETSTDKMVDGHFMISVKNSDQLNKILSALKKIKRIQSVSRE
jgi:GTP pyrophosphokinase